MIKTRFAPSPTGFIHLGNVRTALISALFAWAEQGHFLLRMEDTDVERSQDNFAEKLQEDLRWLALNWQEGVSVEGIAGPYYQSERLAIYEKYYTELQTAGLAYPCFCTDEQLALSRKLQRSRGIAPRYAGTCRHLSAEHIQQKLAEGKQPTLRFAMAQNEKISFDDIVKGHQIFSSDDIGDFIIRRSNGMPTFMFCNAIDDSLMGVTHAIRGDDHLTNTPRQLVILQALKLRTPAYGHISLILGMDGAPLSKRNGSRSIAELRELGYLPLAIVNHLARLGHYYENNQLLSMMELAQQFKSANLSKSPARYDESQLMHWQKLAIETLTYTAFWQWVGEVVKNQIPEEKAELFVATIKPNVVFPEEVRYWATLFFSPSFHLTADKHSIITEAGKEFFVAAIQIIKDHFESAKHFFDALKKLTGVNGKALFMPIRVALTGETHGPEMEGIFQLLGQEKIIDRLQAAINDTNL